MRIAVTLSFLFLLTMFLGCQQAEQYAADTTETEIFPGPPNVVLIVLDTLRADRIGASRDGVPLMPGLEAFANNAAYFRRAYANATWTKPSMVSLFTSLYPGVHNVQYGTVHSLGDDEAVRADAIPDTFETMAELFQQAGYRTLAFQENANMSPVFNMDKGFERYEFHPYPEWTADRMTEEVSNVLAELEGPFFLYAHYMDPHAPYEPPDEYLELFEEVPGLTVQDRDLLDRYYDFYNDFLMHRFGIKDSRDEPDFSEQGKEKIRLLYDAEVRYADDHITSLIAGIQERHPNTYIVFVSDHGEELWEHGSIGHGPTVYDEVAHVDLIIQGPSVSAKAVDHPVMLIDVLPTLAAMAELPVREEWQGIDLFADDLLERPVFIETHSSIQATGIFKQAVVLGDRKLIIDYQHDTAELYDLAADPREQNPLDRPDEVAALRALIDEQNELNRSHPLHSEGDARQLELDDETIEALRAVGYVM